MAEVNTLARPYANAVFDLADSAGNLPAWSDTLERLAAVTVHPDMQQLLGNPLVSGDQLVELVAEACGDALTQEGRNLVCVLVQRKRLTLAPAIAELYEHRRAMAEQRMVAEVHTAVELTDAHREKLAQALKNRFQRDVELKCEIDPSIISGVVVQAGDVVIDHSGREQLHKLKQAIER